MTASQAGAASLQVAGGAAIGALLRFWIGWWASAQGAPSWPWPTLAVNLAGSLALGYALAWMGSGERAAWSPFLAAGALGGFTTFSSFSAESLRMIQDGRWAGALLYALASVLGGVLLAALGWRLAARP